MEEYREEIVIPKEKAVFWMDGEGRWRNEHGTFEHKKIIAYFHASIQKDEHGFFVSQIRDDIREKVYFNYVETAWFVFDVKRNGDVALVLNTKAVIPLVPEDLFIKQDILYMNYSDGFVKFTVHAMMRLADMIEEDSDGKMYFEYQGNRFEIPDR